jgi:type IV secretion system protein VirB9
MSIRLAALSILPICVAAGLTLSLCASPAFAESSPRAVRADQRIRTVAFQNDNVVFLTGTMGVSTMIVFGDEERIATVAMGDSLSWQAVPDQSKRYLFIKPLERDAATNMNVVTNRRIYNFVLHAAGGISKDTVYKLRFSYPEDALDANLLSKAKAMAANPNLSALAAHPEAINDDYGFKGEVINKPKRVVDDGVKTYFEFDGEIPAIFRVKKDRSETLANYRREGDVIVVDGVAAQWTLRNGPQATCIFNLRAVEEPAAKKAMTPIASADEAASEAQVAPRAPGASKGSHNGD